MLLKKLTTEEVALSDEMINHMFLILTENEKYEKQIFAFYKKALSASTPEGAQERLRGSLLKFVDSKFIKIFKNYGDEVLLHEDLSSMVFDLFHDPDSWFYLNYKDYSIDYINKNLNCILADFAKQNYLDIIWEVIYSLVNYCETFADEE